MGKKSFKRTEIDARYYLLLAIIENRSLRYEKAMEYYKKAIKVDPNFLETYLICGLIKHNQRDYKGALEYYEKIIAIDPTYYNVYRFIASAKWDMGDKNANNEWIKRTSAIKDLDRTERQLFNSSDFGNRRKTIIERFDRIIEQFPDSARAYFIRGFVKHWEYDYLNALEDLNTAIRLEPSNAYMYLCRGHIKSSLYNGEGAIADYDKAIELDADLVDAYISRYREKLSSGDYRGFIEDELKAIQLSPRLAHERMVKLQISKKGMMRAELEFKKAISINPKDAPAYCILGYMKYLTGDFEGAKKNLDKSHELNATLDNFESAKKFLESSQRTLEAVLKIKEAYNDSHDTLKEQKLKELSGFLKGTEFESKVDYQDKKVLLQLYNLASYSFNGAEHRWRYAYFENGPKPDKQDFVRIGFTSYFNKNFKCEYCGRQLSFQSKLRNQIDLCSIDHKLPMANGGDSTFSNLVVVCTACNIMKGTMSRDTYIEVIGALKKSGSNTLEKWFEEGLPARLAGKLQKKKHEDKIIRMNRTSK